MKVAYLAGPYTHPTAAGINRNIQAALRVAEELWKIPNLAVICPHGNTQFFSLEPWLSAEESYEKFLAGDFELIRRSEAVVLLPTWGISRGAIREKEFAVSLGKRLFNWPFDRESIADWASM